MKLKYNFAIQQVTDFWAAVPVGADARKYNGVMSLNETARDMMEFLREDITEEQLVDKMFEKYRDDENDRTEEGDKRDYETLREAVRDFVQKLSEAGVLQ